MSLTTDVSKGLKNARAAAPVVDQANIESILRRANRSLGRRLGRIEWIGSLEAYIRQTADAMVDGWTLDTDYPVALPERYWGVGGPSGLTTLTRLEDNLWATERAAHAT